MCKRRAMSLRKLGGDRATEVRFGRFLANEDVTTEELIEGMLEKSNEIAAGEHILAIQDTTEINHSHHEDNVMGLGTVGNGKDCGFFLHPMLLIEAKGVGCLGLGAVTWWNRTKKKSPDYQKLPIEEKESIRWLDTAEATKKNLPSASMITIIADRESDIYEEWCRIPDARTHLLTRACRDRSLDNGQRLFAYTDSLAVQGFYEIEVSAQAANTKKKKPKRTKHKAKLEVSYGAVEILKPGKCTDKKAPEKVILNIVNVKESPETVVKGEAPIEWRLLTTHAVDSFAKACEIIQWYCRRWNIEQLFRVLKQQGFQVESSQLTTAAGLIKLTLIALRAAVQTIQLTLARKGEISRPASDAFELDEIELLEKLQPELEGKTEKQKNHYKKFSLAWAAWTIARLGGWQGYVSERPPGPIAMISGQKEFASMFRGWRLFRNVCIR